MNICKGGVHAQQIQLLRGDCTECWTEVDELHSDTCRFVQMGEGQEEARWRAVEVASSVVQFLRYENWSGSSCFGSST